MSVHSKEDILVPRTLAPDPSDQAPDLAHLWPMHATAVAPLGERACRLLKRVE